MGGSGYTPEKAGKTVLGGWGGGGEEGVGAAHVWPGNRILFYSFALLIYSSVTTSFRLITWFSFVETV